MAKRLWFEKTVVLDSAGGSPTRASTWSLEAEEYLAVHNAKSMSVWGEYAGIGPGAASVTAYLERTPSESDRDTDFEPAGSGFSASLVRSYNSFSWEVGGNAGARIGFPRGKFRVALNNADPSLWAAVHLTVWVELN